MLIRFEAKNHRSIREPVELSMVAIDRDRKEAHEAPNLGESLLPVAGVYGANASGKSNVLTALVWLCDAIRWSLRFWEDKIPVDPFAFTDTSGSPSEFAVELLIAGVRFEYIVELNRDQVVYEALFHFPEKKRRRIFEREGPALRIQRGLGVLSGTRELLTPRTLALSIARRFDEPLVTEFAREMLWMQEFGHVSWRGRRHLDLVGPYPLSMQELRDTHINQLFKGEGEWWSSPGGLEFDDPAGRYPERALALLRLADLGIEDVVVDEDRGIRLLHKSSDGSRPLEFAAESEGTKVWYDLIGPVLIALREGSMLVVDELDSSLHPALSAELIRVFHSPETNPRGAQLIFTSHDTSLLNHLNRDEVWLTEKQSDGSTRLGPLSDFAGERVRKSQNLENAYLRGRFGALPEVDQTAFLRSLGLIG